MMLELLRHSNAGLAPGQTFTQVNDACEFVNINCIICSQSFAKKQQGYWDTNIGTEMKNTPYANTAGRIDVEGEDFDFGSKCYNHNRYSKH